MTTRDDPQASADEQLWILTAALCDGTITPAELAHLEALLRESDDARLFYAAYMDLHGRLQWRFRGGRQEAGDSVPNPTPPILPIILDLSPAIRRPLSAQLFSPGGVLFSYAMSGLIVGIVLLIGLTWRISDNQRPVVRNTTAPPIDREPEMRKVGRVTGMVDCRWADPKTGTFDRAAVSLGRKYALAAGFMEISYDTGAKVILQGPCTYEVESMAGGFLSLGKLTARVEAKEVTGPIGAQRPEGRSGQLDLSPFSPRGTGSRGERTANPTLSQRQPTVGRERQPAASLAPRPSSLFAVRTPTAIVTDLGTEFGVEVAENGATESHVIQGKVDVEMTNPHGASQSRIRVSAGSAVRVESKGKTILAVSYAPRRFASQLAFASAMDTSAERSYIQAVLADKPLAYWPLNEPPRARTFLDRSGNNFHGAALGTVYAGATTEGAPGSRVRETRRGRISAGSQDDVLQAPDGFPSRAVALDGRGYIDIGRQDRFALSNGFTVEAWIRLDGRTWLESPNGQIVSVGSSERRYQRSGWSLGYGIGRAGNQAQPVCCFSCYGVGAVSRVELPPDEWMHLTYVFGPDNVGLLFLNGRPRASFPLAKPAKTGPTWVTLGFGSNMDGEYWRGRLAHVAVYGSTLSQGQIQNHYHRIETGKEGPTMKP
jgi:hypothetical protein